MAKTVLAGHLRFLVYLVVIAAGVGGGLLYLSNVPVTNETTGTRGPKVPNLSWKSTPAILEAANEDFSVESHRSQTSTEKRAGSSWTQFNGPDRTNRSAETGLLESWPEEGPPLLWAANGLGSGYSSVILVDGVIYTMGNKKDAEVVIALDATTGKKIWSIPFGAASHASMGDGPRSTPTYDDGSIYALGAEGGLVCLEAESGKIRWQKNILVDYGATDITWGISESVLIDGDRLICTPGGSKATIVALDKKTGNEIWKSLIPNEHASYASAVVTEVDGVRQYVQFLSNGVAAVRADDGQFLWKESKPSSGTANCSSPLVWDDHIFCASNYGTGGVLLKLTSSNGTTSAELVYHTHDMKSHHGDMVITNGLLFGSNDPGILMCIDVATGKVLWQNRSVGKGAVTWADGKIYLRGEKSDVALVEASGGEYRELGRFTQPDRSSASAWSHPVVADGCLFLRDQGLLLCYDLKRPQ